MVDSFMFVLKVTMIVVVGYAVCQITAQILKNLFKKGRGCSSQIPSVQKGHGSPKPFKIYKGGLADD